MLLIPSIAFAISGPNVHVTSPSEAEVSLKTISPALSAVVSPPLESAVTVKEGLTVRTGCPAALSGRRSTTVAFMAAASLACTLPASGTMNAIWYSSFSPGAVTSGAPMAVFSTSSRLTFFG